jgi:phage baseplate assembly protein W
MTRWTLVVSDETDARLRTFLGSRGAKKGDLSRYVEQAVNRALFEDTVEAVQERNLRYDPDVVMKDVEEAVREVRRAPGS